LIIFMPFSLLSFSPLLLMFLLPIVPILSRIMVWLIVSRFFHFILFTFKMFLLLYKWGFIIIKCFIYYINWVLLLLYNGVLLWHFLIYICYTLVCFIPSIILPLCPTHY
jgi:hypothetical protein